jgi:hypothetical protein
LLIKLVFENLVMALRAFNGLIQRGYSRTLPVAYAGKDYHKAEAKRESVLGARRSALPQRQLSDSLTILVLFHKTNILDDRSKLKVRPG